jgi:hypothetical protein
MKLKAKQILGLDNLNYIPKTGNTSTNIATSLYATTISGGTLYGDGSNLTGIGAGSDTYVTGFTYSNNNLTIEQNLSKSAITVNISTMTGLTVTGTLSATTFQGDGSQLTGIQSTNVSSNLFNYYNFV